MSQALAELDWLVRDVPAKRTQPIEGQLEFGGLQILVTSGYRTKSTNERVRAQGIDGPAFRSTSVVGR